MFFYVTQIGDQKRDRFHHLLVENSTLAEIAAGEAKFCKKDYSLKIRFLKLCYLDIKKRFRVD